MENAMILLYDICRLCLDEPGVDNIFKPVDFSKDILTYTGVKVTTTDKLPQTICTSCRDIIACVKVLKDVATTNDARLQAIRGKIGDNDTQNESSAPSEITSSSVNVSLKDRITFEGEKRKKKQSKKKKKSSSEREDSAPKMISVRKDLFDTSTTVTSSTKTSEPSPSSTSRPSSPSKDAEKKVKVTSSTKPSEPSPSSTSSPSKDAEKKVKVTSTTMKRGRSPTISPGKGPEKIVKVNGKELKVYEFEYKCETCNKTYATHKKLYLHQLAHNKKFNCPLDGCGKMFAIKGDLQKHIRSHTGEKPFKCNLCEQSFTQNGTLKAHKQNKHNEFKSQS